MSAEITLDTKVSNLVKFEKNTGVSLMTAFGGGNLSLTVLVELVKACSDATDEDIDTFIQEQGFEVLADKLTGALKNSGFLPKDAQTTDKAA